MSHSIEGSQFTSREWQLFLRPHNPEASMSRRGNCHDDAVAESFFHLLKRERIRRRTCLTREAARQDVFEYIEMFCNPKRKRRTTECCHAVTAKSGSRNGARQVSRKLGAPQNERRNDNGWWMRHAQTNTGGRWRFPYFPQHLTLLILPAKYSFARLCPSKSGLSGWQHRLASSGLERPPQQGARMQRVTLG
ncbi:MAG: hypothetical protein RLZZ413_2620 [Pseudomonadota bacterium]